jgi:DNA topoisomerase-1
MKTLVIVESPTKAKTITKFLGKGYIVKSSFGHVRDLPKSKLGVDTEKDFAPQYVVSKDKTAVVKELKDAAKKADGVLFATDEDREGEAISYHLAYLLGIDPKEAKRITFHEITAHAINESLKHPRALDLPLVDAQQARRVLDRLVGYKLSPLLWHKVARGLSAGRVQSVAVRLVVEREREITAFKPDEYWTLEGLFKPEKGKAEPFGAKLSAINGKKLDKLDLNNKAQVDEIVTALAKATYKVADLEQKKTTRTPPAPYTTSSLQQEANTVLGFSAKQTMMLAQQLYEGLELGSEGHVGLITYMRTDAVNLAQKFLDEARATIGTEYGEKYQLSEPRKYKNKNKSAQEAHEAIRPSEAGRTPELVKPFLNRNQYRLYDLIWRRAVATQMAAAELTATSLDIDSANGYRFHATGQTMQFDGWLKLYPNKSKEDALPELTVGEAMNCTELKPEQHFTEPPARYNDASLVKALEEHGIGRPSTYAPTLATIEARHYVLRDEKKRFMPTDIAYLVNDLLVEHFPNIVDLAFTADMENKLDEIEEGKTAWQPVIKEFYVPFEKIVEQKEEELDKKKLTEEKTDEQCDKCGKPMVIKVGRFGKFLACSGYPECKNTKPLPGSAEAEARANAPLEMTDEKCEKCGEPMVRRMGRYGAFLGCSGYPKCRNIKSIEIKVNLKCPKCKEGDVIQRRSKRGRIFYGCNKYPNCDFALWDKPTGEFCPDSKDPLVYAAKGMIKCSNKECGFKKEAAPEGMAEAAPATAE